MDAIHRGGRSLENGATSRHHVLARDLLSSRFDRKTPRAGRCARARRPGESLPSESECLVNHPTVDQLQRFSALVEEHVGLALGAESKRDLEQCLGDRAEETHGGNVEAYLRSWALRSFRPFECGAVADALAARETWFFRDANQIAAFVNEVVPALRQDTPDSVPLRVLAVGCATGEEAWSIGMALSEANVVARVVGIDVSGTAIQRARQKRYPIWSLRAASDGVRARYFHTAGDGYALEDASLHNVSFERRSVFEPDEEFWHPRSWDVIFCRNVLSHFSSRRARDAVDRLHRALRPGGYLFLGASELAYARASMFIPVRAREACFYRALPSATDRPPGAVAQVDLPTDAQSSPRAADPEGKRATPRLAHSRLAITHRPSIHDVTKLLAIERYDEALEVLDRIPYGDDDVEIVGVRAAIHLHLGHYATAEALCDKALARIESHAAANYVMGMCRERYGSLRAASAHYRRAIESDPRFVLAHLQLGLVCRRLGDLEGCRNSFRAALPLLRVDADPALHAFAGALPRQALVAMCQSELERCGSAA